MAGGDEDPFDSLLFIEDRLQEQGYREGYEYGVVEGLKEAVEAGKANGQDVVWEIGYYHGFSETWLRLLKNQPMQERKIRVLSVLNEKLRSFKILDVNSSDYRKEFSLLQAKYRQILSLLKVPGTVKDETDLSF